MSTRGREVLRGKLSYRARKGNGASKKKRAVAAYCGIGNGSVSAQIHVCEDYEKMGKPGSKPKNSIKLDGAKIESSSSTPPTSHTNSPAYGSTTLAVNGGLKLSSSPASLPSSQNGTPGDYYAFIVATSNGEVHEFRTDTENERLRWVKLLQLLVMYPYSIIPEEPETNPISNRFRQTLEAKQYGADSVWPVYILPEEVGSKCGIIGLHILALHNGIPNVSMGQLDIISPTDHQHPVVTWDRDKMRRTGKTGHLVFIEIGRRCIGGPGLVWMYTGYQNDSQALRETLHKFLFLGDGSAVTTNSQPQNLYDLPRNNSVTSVDSLPSSQIRSNSNSNHSGYHNHLLTRSKSSQDHDSGFHSIGSTEKAASSSQFEAPQVRLDKHPSIYRKHRDSEPRRSCGSINSPCGSFGERELSETLFDCEHESSSSVSGGVGHSNDPDIMAMDGDMAESNGTKHVYDFVKPLRSHSHTNYIPRAPITTASDSNGAGGNDFCAEGEYMSMVNPRSKSRGGDGYVLMRPASQGSPLRASTSPVPMPQGGGKGMDHDEYNTLQHYLGRQNSSSSLKNSQNYETLPTIAESGLGGRRPRPPCPVPSPEQGRDGSSNYENYPLPQDLKGVMPRNYRPSYENRDGLFRGRRGSMEPYENVPSSTSVESVEVNTNDNNNGKGVSKRKFSFKRRNSDKETVSFGNRTSSPAPVPVS